MRCFIALAIPSQNRPQFQAIQDSLHTLIPQVKITNKDKLIEVIQGDYYKSKELTKI